MYYRPSPERTRRALPALVLTTVSAMVLAGLPFPVSADDETTETHSYIATDDGKKIFDDEFAKLLKEKLGGEYQNAQVVIRSCYGGGFAEEASKTLAGDYSVNTARDEKHACSMKRGKSLRTIGGDEGLKIGDYWYHGWLAQWIKKFKEDNDSTSEELADAAKTKDHKLGGNPQYETGGTGKDAKIRDGAKSNHVVIASNGGTTFDDPFISELVKTLKAAGYTDDEIDWAHDNSAGKQVGGQNVDRNYTKENIVKMLEDLRKALDKNPGMEKATVIINSHGSTEKRKVDKKDGAQNGAPGQGGRVNPGANQRISSSTTHSPKPSSGDSASTRARIPIPASPTTRASCSAPSKSCSRTVWGASR